MTILQVAGEDESWDILNGSVSTAPAGFRAGYARCSIHSNNDDGVQIVYKGDLKAYLDAQPAGDKDYWFTYRAAGGGGFTTGGIAMKLYDSADKVFLRLKSYGAGDWTLETSPDGSTFTGYPASSFGQAAPSGNPHQLSFRVKIHPTLGHIAWYINGSFWFQTTAGDTTGLCSGSPKFQRFGPGNSNGACELSEFIATSADDPGVGKSLVTLAPTADGLTGWAGGYGSINEIVKDTGTQVRTGTAATDVSFVVSDVPALSGSVIIRALCVSGEYAANAGGGVPQHLNQFLRLGGTIYPGALKTVGAVVNLLQTFWHTSPVTSTTITETEGNSTEIGMRSAA